MDIGGLLAERNPALLRKLPPGSLWLVRRVAHERLVSAILSACGHMNAADFCEHLLQRRGIRVHVIDGHFLDRAQRPIVCANHPTGGLEGVALIATILRRRGHCRVPANELLRIVTPLAPLVIPVFRRRPGRREMRHLSQTFAGDDPILVFPAGVTARVYGGVLREYPWESSFVTRARRTAREVVPVFVSGRNSRRFYLIHRLRRVLGIGFNVEMSLLVDELLRRRNETLTLRFGPPRRVIAVSATPTTPATSDTLDQRTADRHTASLLRHEVKQLGHVQHKQP